MARFTGIVALALAESTYVFATNLFVSDDGSLVTTFRLTSSKNGSHTLDKIATNNDCGPSPSWLTLDSRECILYCIDKGSATTNGTITSFSVATDGSLAKISSATTLPGPVYGNFYAGGRGMAVAHYGGAAVSSWTLDGKGKMSLNQNIPFTLAKAGPMTAKQSTSRPHEAITDPTGQYIVVPDLGADLVRVFSYDHKTLALKSLAPLPVASGSGPRHAAFWTPSSSSLLKSNSTSTTGTHKTYLYVVHQLDSTVTGYAVTYCPNNSGLNFSKVYKGSTYGSLAQPSGNAPAEIQVTPDNKYLIISNRDSKANGTSDQMSTFRIGEDGKLDLTQLWPSGGAYPRQFSINNKGDLIAVGNQDGKSVVLFERDLASGAVAGEVAKAVLEEQVSCVIFDE